MTSTLAGHVHARPPEHLSEMLYKAASEAARRAMRVTSEYETYEEIQTAVAAGQACEWLLRSAIARIHPALLAETGPNKRDSLIALLGSAPTNTSALDLKTIQASETARLAAKLYPKATFSIASAELTFAVRNAATHMAMTDRAAIHQAVAALASVAKPFLDVLGKSEVDFWGVHNAPAAIKLREGKTYELEMRLDSKLRTAAAQFRALTFGLNADATARLVAVMSGRTNRVFLLEVTEDVVVPCPACESPSSLTCVREPGTEDQWEYEVEYRVRPVWLIPSLLQCLVCDLELDAEELQLTDLGSAVESTEPEFEDIPMREPDEDEFFGR